MATALRIRPKIVSDQPLPGEDLLEVEKLAGALKRNPGDLDVVCRFVQINEGKFLQLPNNLKLRICGLSGTVYMGQNYMLESWKNLYLPRKTNMVVLGAVDNCLSMAPGNQLVILVAETGHIFAYEDEELHKISNSCKEFFKEGITITNEVYSYPDTPSPAGSDQDEEIQKIRAETRQFVNKSADVFKELLDKF
ncbi:hypothetical protein GDO86_014034 [Hymenochirus boettgeri]|uniref:Uncharacterized protein n=1 Tax=Hymenochirus boettgeri TaxID=247094 RepID=A0A8T2JMB1_9PIPI|nr:hypothetical protein GDO86_014034 [Hymenochirus boettgeri]